VWTYDTGLYVAPVPAPPVIVTHFYYSEPLALVLDADAVANLPAVYTDAIVAKAAELLSAREDDTTARAAHSADYARWVDKMRRDVKRSTGPTVPRVRPGGWI